MGHMARLAHLAAIVVYCGAVQAVGAANPFEGTESFLEANCAYCHNSVDLNGNLDLEALQYNPDEPDNFARWVKIHDRVKCG